MKTLSNIIFILCLPLFSIDVLAQNTSENYIMTRNILNENATEYTDEIQYYDGLGRPIQNVKKGITPELEDLVTLQEYDPVGRIDKTWLPTPNSGNGCITDEETLKAKAISFYNNDSQPYSFPVYENSPMNTILEEHGPGESWNEHIKKIEYLTNQSSGSLSCKYYYMQSLKLKDGGYYDADQLYVTKTTDEDNHISYTFKNKEDKILLSKQVDAGVHLDTYYVYDTNGNLCYVLPPMINGDISTENLNLYAYYYKYETTKNLCIEKKLPGCETVFMVYDNAGHLIYSQDGELRKKDLWLFYIYDKWGRIVITGKCKNTSKNQRNNVYIATFNPLVEGVLETGYYLNFSLKEPQLLTVSYYDDYQFLNLNLWSKYQSTLQYTLPKADYDNRYSSAKGLLTGTCVKMLEEPDKEIVTTNYYNEKGLIIQSKSNNHLKGYEKKYFKYTFTGNKAKYYHEHEAYTLRGVKKNLTEEYAYDYDHAERLTKTRYSYNGGTEIILSENLYNQLGNLKTKKMGDGAISIDYGYNLRGWLTSINNDKFTQEIHYDQPSPGNAPYYNGNVSEMNWKLTSDKANTKRGYKYNYDGLSRLKSATYFEPILGRISYENARAYNENMTYDRNGNIMRIEREGLTNIGVSSYKFGMIDNLSLTYSGNQLKAAADYYTEDLLYEGAFDFVDGASLEEEYIYDSNGNMIQDKNKNITTQYNNLNLPSRIKFSGNRMTDYLYDANGVKYREKYMTMSSDLIDPPFEDSDATYNSYPSYTDFHFTEYCGNILYKNGGGPMVLTEEGGKYEGNKYAFFIKDYLGNVRSVIDLDMNTKKTFEASHEHYYPFGTSFGEKRLNNTWGKEYTGKELNKMHGLNIYDYGARMYDPIIGRFNTIDPLAEKCYSVSPYAYCQNNPINRIDPDGRTDFILTSKGRIVQSGKSEGKTDQLISGNKNIVVNDKSILPGLVGNRSGEVNKQRHYQTTRNMEDAVNVFKFAADNSVVEWKLDIYKDNEGTIAIIATDLSPSNVTMTNKNEMVKGKEKKVDIHSHPDENGTRGGSKGDMESSENGVKSAVYHKSDKVLYEYNSNNKNTNSTKIDNDINPLLKFAIP